MFLLQVFLNKILMYNLLVSIYHSHSMFSFTFQGRIVRNFSTSTEQSVFIIAQTSFTSYTVCGLVSLYGFQFVWFFN